MRQLATLLLLILCWPASVSADQVRVLMSFTADSHRVERVFKLPAVSAGIQAQVLQSRTAIKQRRSGVMLQWLDAAGAVLAVNIIADPRVTHAPSHEGPIPDKFLKPDGVYLVNGPAQSSQLRLAFPSVTLSTRLIPASEFVLSLPPP